MSTEKTQLSLSKVRKIIIMIIVSIEAGALYRLPYLYETFYDQFMELFGVTNTQIGLLVSIFGIVGTIECMFSGVLADRFSPRKMITIGMTLMGICGFVFSAAPNYGVVATLYAAMALSSGIFFYCPSLRALSVLDDEDGQGKVFGTHEGIKGVTSAVATAIVLAIVTNSITEVAGMRFSYMFYGALYLALAIASWIFIPDLPAENKSKEGKGIDFTAMKELLKTPGLWYCMMMMWGWYSVMDLMAYTTPFLTGVFGVGTAAMGVIAIIRSYAIGIFAAPISGHTGAKIGSCSKVTVITCLVMVLVSLGLMLIPEGQQYVGIVSVLAVMVGLCVYCCRGTSWANLPEANIPLKYMGTATGLISVVAFSPDIYIFTLAGHLLDTHGDAGYRYIFAIMLAMSVIGLFGSYMVRRTQLKAQRSGAAE